MPSGMFGYGLRSPYCVDYAKRRFSHVPRAVTDKNDKVGFSDERNNEKTSAVKVFNKHWKRAKSFAAHKRNEAQRKNASNSTDTQLEGTDMVNSREQLVGNGVEDASSGPSVSNSHVGNKNKLSEDKGKHKQQSRSKKSKGQSHGTNAAIDAPTKPEGSEKVSQAKIPNMMAKKNQSLPVTEVGNFQTCLILMLSFYLLAIYYLMLQLFRRILLQTVNPWRYLIVLFQQSSSVEV